MPLRNYSLRIIGEAENADTYRKPLRDVAGRMHFHYFTTRADAGDLLATIVFNVPDEPVQQSATGDELLIEVKKALPVELHPRISLNVFPWPDRDA
jgi:hypothetical protein